MKRYTVEKRKIPSAGRGIKSLIFPFKKKAKEAIAKFEAEFVTAAGKYCTKENVL